MMQYIDQFALLDRLKLRALTPDVDPSKIDRAYMWKTLVLWLMCGVVIAAALFCVVKMYG